MSHGKEHKIMTAEAGIAIDAPGRVVVMNAEGDGAHHGGSDD
jgi:hypothetical protein